MSLYVIYYCKIVNITSMIWKVMHISDIMKFFFSQYYKMVHYVVNNHLINKGISDDAGDTKWQCFELQILAQSDSQWNFSHVLSMDLMDIVFFGIKSGHIYRWHSRTREHINSSPQYSVSFMSNYFQLKDGCVGKTNFTGNNENMMKFR